MARGAKSTLNEYELKRQEQIAKNQELLRSLALDAQQAGLAPSAPKPRSSTPAKRKAPVKKEKEEILPRYAPRSHPATPVNSLQENIFQAPWHCS